MMMANSIANGQTKAQKLWGVSHVQVGRLRKKYPEYFK
jgi:hypothetical protein